MPAEYEMWFNDNGSGYNFSSIGFNMTKGRESVVNMLDNGYWSQRWGSHMEKTNRVHWVNPRIANKNCNELPDPSSWDLHPEAEIFCYVDNETGNGFNMHFPFKGFQPEHLVVDMCSSLGYYDVNFKDISYGFHTVKKSGVMGGSLCVNFWSDEYKDFQCRDDAPEFLNWRKEMNWCGYKCPSMVSIYFTYLVYKHLAKNHNLRTHADFSAERAKVIYDAIE